MFSVWCVLFSVLLCEGILKFQQLGIKIDRFSFLFLLFSKKQKTVWTEAYLAQHRVFLEPSNVQSFILKYRRFHFSFHHPPRNDGRSRRRCCYWWVVKSATLPSETREWKWFEWPMITYRPPHKYWKCPEAPKRTLKSSALKTHEEDTRVSQSIQNLFKMEVKIVHIHLSMNQNMTGTT